MKTKGVLYSVALLLLSSALIFAAGEPEGAKGKPAAAAKESKPVISFEKKISFEYMKDTYNPKPGNATVKFIEDKFNVSIKWTTFGWADYRNGLNLRVASGDMPELTTYIIPDTVATYKNLYLDKKIRNISTLVEKYGFANLLNHYATMPDMGFFKEKEGFFQIPVRSGDAQGALYMRKDWMDAQKIPMPKTYDDYKKTLKAFVDADPDGNRTTGLGAKAAMDIQFVLPGFTGLFTDGWYRKDGRWTSQVYMPEYKEALKYLNSLFKEGLLDREFAITNRANMLSKFYQGKIGSFSMASGNNQWNEVLTALKKVNPKGEITLLVPFPSGPAGNKKPNDTGYQQSMMIPVTVEEEKAVRILSIADWLMTKEGFDFVGHGIEGIHYQKKDGQIAYIAEARARDFDGSTNSAFFQFAGRTEISRLLYTGMPKENYIDSGRNGVASQVFFGLTSDRAIQLEPFMKEIPERWFIKFVTGESSIDADYDKFIAEYKKVGLDDYLKEMEKAYPNK